MTPNYKKVATFQPVFNENNLTAPPSRFHTLQKPAVTLREISARQWKCLPHNTCRTERARFRKITKRTGKKGLIESSPSKTIMGRFRTAITVNYLTPGYCNLLKKTVSVEDPSYFYLALLGNVICVLLLIVTKKVKTRHSNEWYIHDT